MEGLATVLEGFLSKETNVRQQAEGWFNEAKKTQPEHLAEALLGLLVIGAKNSGVAGADASPTEGSTRRQQACIALRSLLREFISGKAENAWVAMSDAMHTRVQSTLIELCLVEANPVVLSSLGDLVGDLGETLLVNESWPELVPAIYQMVVYEDAGSLESQERVNAVGLRIAAALEPFMSKFLVSDQLPQLFERHLASGNAEVIRAAVQLLGEMLTNEERPVVKQLEAFILPVTQIITIGALVPSPQNPAVRRVEVPGNVPFHLMPATVGDPDGKLAEKDSTFMLQLLIETVAANPEPFKNCVETIMPYYLALCVSTLRDEDLRQLGMEFILTYIDTKHKSSVKVAGFVEKVVETLMSFLLDTDDEVDEAWFDKDLVGKEDDDDESVIYNCGEYGLDRIANAIDDKDFIMGLIFARIGDYLRSQGTTDVPAWKYRVAGIIAVCQTCEYMSEAQVETQLGEVISLLIAQSSDEQHYKVRFAACRALAQTALDHQPFAQEKFHQIVLPALIKRMDDPVARVQAQALAAFVNYAEEVDLEDLMAYIPIVLGKLFAKLDANYDFDSGREIRAPVPEASLRRRLLMIREQTVTSVAVVAGVMGKRFLEYCPQVVPLMKEIVSTANTPETRQMRGRALECLSIIAFSVGLEQVQDDCVQIVRALVQLYKTELESDDPVKEYVNEALRRMAAVMTRAFAEFNFELVPALLSNLKMDVDEAQHAIDDCSEKILNKDFSLLAAAGGHRADGLSGVNTSRLEDMEKDLKLLSAIVEHTKGNFAPHIQETMAVVVPLLQLKMSDAVRRASLMAMAELIGAARDGNASLEQIQQWVLSAIDIVLKVVADDAELMYSGVDHLSANISGLARCIENAGPKVLTAEQVKFVCDKVWQCIADSSTRRAELEQTRADQKDEIDEETAEEFDDERDREQTFRETCIKVLEAVMKNSPEDFLAVSAREAVQFIRTFIDAARPADDRLLACFVFCDVIQKFNAQGLNLVGNTLETIVISTLDPDPVLRQTACYAISLVMEIPSVQPEIVRETTDRLVKLIADPTASTKKNRSVTENAISALLNIALNQHAVVGEQTARVIIDNLLTKLPCNADEDEARKTHNKLLQALLQDPHQNSIAWGSIAERSHNLEQIVCISAQIYKSMYSDEPTDKIIPQLIKNLGVDTIRALVANQKLSDIQKRGLVKIERDFQTL